MAFEFSVQDLNGVFAKLAQMFRPSNVSVQPKMSGTVIPVVDTLTVAGQETVISESLNLIPASTEVYFTNGTVPQGETWLVKHVYHRSCTGAAGTGIGFVPKGDANNAILFQARGTASAAASVNNIWMTYSDRLYAVSTGDAGDGGIVCQVVVRKYKIGN